MKKFLFVAFALALLFPLIGIVSAACCNHPCWGNPGPYNRVYDPDTVETISGEVLSVDQSTSKNGNWPGVHLTLKTDQETIAVHLGPSWFIENQDIKIEVKDFVEVKGSRVTYDGEKAIVAAKVIKGDQELKLRDDDGTPVWSGWRKRRN